MTLFLTISIKKLNNNQPQTQKYAYFQSIHGRTINCHDGQTGTDCIYSYLNSEIIKFIPMALKNKTWHFLLKGC